MALPADSAEDRVVELVNAERALVGLPALTRHAGLASAASDYAAAMAGGGLFSHTSLDGSGVQDREEAHGYAGWTFLGENLAAGQSKLQAIQSSLVHLHAAGDTRGILDQMITMEERGRVTRKDVLDDLERRFTQP